NGSLQAVLQNLSSLVKTQKELLKKKPCIVCQFIVMKHNEHQIEEFLALQIGADKKMIKKVQIYNKEDISDFLPANENYNRYHVTDQSFLFKYQLKNRCGRLWNQPVVNWDGSVSVCCFDKDNALKIGNITHTGFRTLWKSNEYASFRQKVLLDRKSIAMCQNCDEGLK
ncbi:MAG: SPASM domain-containing protein, partial [Candidatus Cloacimonetes bacterium]|nr:SPASM domain-containing protein [Candidatus Cloacimonadota bacterium]